MGASIQNVHEPDGKAVLLPRVADISVCNAKTESLPHEAILGTVYQCLPTNLSHFVTVRFPYFVTDKFNLKALNEGGK